MNTDLTFITNEPALPPGRPEASLLNRFKVLTSTEQVECIKDARFFDSLVGYF